ncbi:hypothetical protein F2P56_034133 [Juglans regia]|uniref:Pathogenesis-related protein 5-like n=2 Tax=Juglans regia TaxID=51240 RepID=A0A833U6R2_JUGRE|nr:pathogenesis-related protein 5-like [Juglans regia]KAF5445050.1 hypothetical protein F2P56_034133 [Juglans regia]
MGKEISQLSPLLLLLLLMISSGSAAILSFLNECSYTVWPATFSGNDGPALGDGSFSLAPGQSIQLIVDPGWSGRVWARTGCNFDSSGNGKCLTGDCGSLNCIGDGQPPFTLARFIISLGTTDNTFYDISLVEGYNVGMRIDATGGTTDCQHAGCIADLNCPPELRVVDFFGSVVACKSECGAFNEAQCCCADDYSTPQTCSRTQYAEMFKACPNDVSSRFTCSGSNFLITFCPEEL